MEGADVAQLRALGQRFARSGDDLKRMGAMLSAQISGSPWQGGDAGVFRSNWSTSHHPTLVHVGAALHDAATALARNADEQERASAGAGAAAGAAVAAAVAAATHLTPPSGGSPQAVKDWWDSLSASEQESILHDHPERVGNLDGLPGTVRDEANRALLPQKLAAMEAYVAAHPDDAGAAQDLKGLQALTRMMHDQPGYQLLLLDDSGHPLKAAVANGDIDTADHLIAHVPGTTADVAGMAGDMNRVTHLSDEAARQLQRHGIADPHVVGINWMGYDAPDAIVDPTRLAEAEAAAKGAVPRLGDILHPGKYDDRIGDSLDRAYGILGRDGGTTQDAINSAFAKDGAPAFAHFGEGLRVNGGDGTRIVADAHSYGAAVAGGAAMQTSAFDALVTSGGPGTMATDAAQLHLKDGLYVSEAQWSDQDYGAKIDVRDPIGSLKSMVGDGGDFVPDIHAIDPQHRFGADPSQMPGAHVFDDGSVGSAAQHGDLISPHGHSSYWDVGTHSLYNDAAVVAGYPGEANYR